MDAEDILDGLAEDFFRGWDVMPTGGGFLIVTDWTLPNNERIEIHVRKVGEREDLFIVTDGGELIGFLFSHGVDISKDPESRRVLNGISENRSIKITDYEFVKGAGEDELPGAVRGMLEAIKEASFSLWHKIASKPADPVH